MVRSTIPYTLLKDSGFAEAEIADWVKRPKGVAKKTHTPAKKDEAPPKTAHTEVKEDEIPSEQPPMGIPSHRMNNQQPLQSSAVFSQLEQSKSHSRSYKGYSEAQLKQMDAQQLKELGLVKIQDSIYTVSEGQNGRIVFDPVQWEVQESSPVPEDPAIKIAVRGYSSEIASIVKSIAMSPKLFLSSARARLRHQIPSRKQPLLQVKRLKSSGNSPL
jgi:hypothetical protein